MARLRSYDGHAVDDWWSAYKRANLHALGVDDKTIQAILWHSNIALTMNVYVKSVSQSQESAMDELSQKLGTCNILATNQPKLIQ